MRLPIPPPPHEEASRPVSDVSVNEFASGYSGEDMRKADLDLRGGYDWVLKEPNPLSFCFQGVFLLRLRGKIGLGITGFILTALLLGGFFRFEAEREITDPQMVQRGIALLRSLTIPCSIAMANHDSATLDDYLAGFVDSGREMDIYYLTILDSERRVLSDTRAGFFRKVLDDEFMKKAASSTGASFRTTRLNGEEAIEVAVPVISGLRWGTLVAGFRLDRLEQELARRKTRFAIASSLVSLFGGLLRFGFYRRWL